MRPLGISAENNVACLALRLCSGRHIGVILALIHLEMCHVFIPAVLALERSKERFLQLVSRRRSARHHSRAHSWIRTPLRCTTGCSLDDTRADISTRPTFSTRRTGAAWHVWHRTLIRTSRAVRARNRLAYGFCYGLDKKFHGRMSDCLSLSVAQALPSSAGLQV